MEYMSIAVIIPLYNGKRWIAEALGTVFAQTRLPNEVIVVDDGSTDGGAAIVEEIANTHPVKLISKTNGGQSSARNMGVRYSKGNFIAFLDQDDGWYPDHLELLAKAFQGNLDLGWAYSDVDVVDEHGHMLKPNYVTSLAIEHPKHHFVRCLKEDMHILPSATMIRRSAFESVGGFDPALIGYEDDDLFLRMFAMGWGNHFLIQPLSYWRHHDQSASHTPHMIASKKAYARKLVSAYPNYYDVFASRFFDPIPLFTHAVCMKDRRAMRSAYADMKLFGKALGRVRRAAIWTLGLSSNPTIARGILSICYRTRVFR